jgi:hypothetical protein
MRHLDSPGEEIEGGEHPFQDSITAAAISSYFVDIFKHNFKTGSLSFSSHIEGFLSGILGDIPLPQGIERGDLIERYRVFISNMLDEKKLVAGLDEYVNSPRRIDKMLRKYRSRMKQLMSTAEVFQHEEYPGRLSVEIYRAILTYRDGMKFMAGVLSSLFKTRAGWRKAPTQRMMIQAREKVNVEFLGSFLTFLLEFSRLLAALQIWSSSSLDEIFQIKTLRFDMLPPAVLDERLFMLQDSVSSFRDQLTHIGGLPVLEKVDPVTEDSLREIALAMISQ